MIQTLTRAGRWARLRAPLLALAVLAGACDSADNLATTEPVSQFDSVSADVPATPATDSVATDSSIVAFEPTQASVRYTGIPFGPFGLWGSATTTSTAGLAFSGSHNYTSASNIITQISAARNKSHRLVLAMTGGPSYNYTTNGKFDFNKWKRKMNTFNTSAIRRAVAAGVYDGTITGNALIDEPETRQWGGVITKRLLDQMASYAKAIFPTLPMGVNYGPTGYQWRASERYNVVDYTLNQYAWWITRGNVTAWRDKVRAQASRDGVKVGFSLNVLNGGVQDRTGWDCRGTGGLGTRYPNCRVTADQLKSWSQNLGLNGCVMIMWRYDRAFVTKSTNVTAMKAVNSRLSQAARRSCR
jgi:hypothetical protein